MKVNKRFGCIVQKTAFVVYSVYKVTSKCY